MTFYYKIQRADGLFSSGGSWPHWNRHGKVWKSGRAVISHLLLIANSGKQIPADWNVVGYELRMINDHPATEVAAKALERRQTRLVKQQESAKKRVEAERRRQFLKLKAEFEPNQ